MIVLASDAHGPADVVTGLYAYLPKPFDLSDLLRLVRQATHGEPAPARDTGVVLAGIS